VAGDPGIVVVVRRRSVRPTRRAYRGIVTVVVGHSAAVLASQVRDLGNLCRGRTTDWETPDRWVIGLARS